jgi:hypothetical protein
VVGGAGELNRRDDRMRPVTAVHARATISFSCASATAANPRKSRQQRPIGGPEPRPAMLAVKHRQLVAQHENLKLVALATTEQ